MDWMSLLSDEIVAEILLQLPAGDVVRSKLVCKLWYGLITNSRFAKSHLRRWADRGGIACKMCFSESDSELFYHSLDDSVVQPFNMPFDGSGIESCIGKLWHDSIDGSRLLDHHDSREFHVDYYDILDSCDGLLLTRILIHDQESYKDVFFVCNPETRLGILLPILNRHGMLSFYRGHIIYDPSVQKYKVAGTKFECVTDLYECYLIELDRGERQLSPWKELKVPREAEEGKVIASVGIDGKLHLLRKAAKRLLKKTTKRLPLRLLSLDLTTEEFEARDCPPTPFPKSKGWSRRIFGSSGMFYHMVSVSQNELDLWSLRDLNDPVWFSRRVTISSPPPPPYWDDSFLLLGVLKDDSKLVFFSPPKRTFFISETTSGKYRRIPFMTSEDTTLISEGRRIIHWNAIIHVNSLISWNRRRS